MEPIQTLHTFTRKDWERWLSDERHVSRDVVDSARLTLERDGSIGIPVRDENGLIVFYKYRRNPRVSEGPKYRYDKGSTAMLYGAELLPKLNSQETVYVVEGEFDALALRSLGYHAVSSTGGAGTWRHEWSEMLGRFFVVIAYDADRAGVEGALRVASMTPGASIAWLPAQYGKDPTEILHRGHGTELVEALRGARSYTVPVGEDGKRLEKLRTLSVQLIAERAWVMQQPDMTPLLIDFAITWIAGEIEGERKASVTRFTGTKFQGEMAQMVEHAKHYPVSKLVKVDRFGMAKCVYHAEKNPSMKVYPDGHVFSYCCGKRSDAIEIYRALNHCDFKTAVNALCI